MPSDFVRVTKDGVYANLINYSYPTKDFSPHSFLPTGVVFSSQKGSFDYDSVLPGYNRYDEEYAKFETNIFSGRMKFETIFEQLANNLSTLNGLVLVLKNFWEDENSDKVFINRDFNNPKSIIDFLLKNKTNTLENGFIEIELGSRVGKPRLQIRDHKNFIYFTDDKSEHTNVLRILKRNKLPHLRKFKYVDSGCYHFHYKPDPLMTKKKFLSFLNKNGFKLLKEIPVEN